MIGIVAEFEREMINERAAEGRKAAREKGVKFGAKRKLNNKDVASIINLIDMGESKANLAEIYGVGKTTLYRLIKEYKNKQNKIQRSDNEHE